MGPRLLAGLTAGLVVSVLAPPVASAQVAENLRFIVVLRDGIADPGAVAKAHGVRYGAAVQRVYRSAVSGYVATVPAARLHALRRDPHVAYVEPDRPVTGVGQTLPWGIDSIGGPLSSTVAGDGSGMVDNVNVYVIDSGLDREHADLNVVDHVTFEGSHNRDCDGHGTHVGGTVAARDNTLDVVGAAPGARLTGVKVLDCKASGTVSGVIAGVDWVTSTARKPAVANLSLGAAPSQALDDAVRRSAASGIFYTVAAGNEGADACASSPARTGAGTDNGILTVAATNSTGAEPSWSNYGPCVDVWAPGASIVSTKRGGGTTSMSGTSMAAPHAAGGAALFLSTRPAADPLTVERALREHARLTGGASKDGRSITGVNTAGW